MADQFTDLGFRMTAPDALDHYFSSCWDQKELIDLEDGLYLRLQTAPGIQTWFSIHPEDQSLLDWEMHFATDHQCGVALDADLQLDDAGQSGNLRMLLHPGEETELPIVAAVPALAFWPDREPGAPGLAQFACYAQSLTILPGGVAESLSAQRDEPEAVITGRVLACHSCVNAHSHGSFWHISLACCGETLDLLCDETLLKLPLAAGVTVQASCRITAMVESGVTG